MIIPTSLLIALPFSSLVSAAYLPFLHKRIDNIVNVDAKLLGDNLYYEVCNIAQDTYAGAAALGLAPHNAGCSNPLDPMIIITPLPLLCGSTDTVESSTTSVAVNTVVSGTITATSSTTVASATSSATAIPVYDGKFSTGTIAVNDKLTGNLLGYLASGEIPLANTYHRYNNVFLTPDITLAMIVQIADYSPNNTFGFTQLPAGDIVELYLAVEHKYDITAQPQSGLNSLNTLIAPSQTISNNFFSFPSTPFTIGALSKNGTYPLSLQYTNSDNITTVTPDIVSFPFGIDKITRAFSLYFTYNATSLASSSPEIAAKFAPGGGANIVTFNLVPTVGYLQPTNYYDPTLTYQGDIYYNATGPILSVDNTVPVTGVVMVNNTITGEFLGYLTQVSSISPQEAFLTKDFYSAMIVNSTKPIADGTVSLVQVSLDANGSNQIYVGIGDPNKQLNNFENQLYFGSTNPYATAVSYTGNQQSNVFIVGNYTNGGFPLRLKYTNSDGTAAYPSVVSSYYSQDLYQYPVPHYTSLYATTNPKNLNNFSPTNATTLTLVPTFFKPATTFFL